MSAFCIPRRMLTFKSFLIGLLFFCSSVTLISSVSKSAAQSQCGSGCRATAPQSAKPREAVSFNAETSSADCAVAPAVEWDFGDGSPRRATGRNTTHQYDSPGTYNWRMTASTAAIETVAGGHGENVPAKQAQFVSPTDIALDPKGRGYYVIENGDFGGLLRFVNTTQDAVTVGNRKIPGGAVQRLVGGGSIIKHVVEDTPEDNIPGRQVNVVTVPSIAVSPEGDLVYVIDSSIPSLFVFNASSETKSVCGKLIDPGNVANYSVFNPGSRISAVAVNPVNGSLYVADIMSPSYKIYRVDCSGVSVVAGNGANTGSTDDFKPGLAIETPLLTPHDITFDRNGNLYIADTGHARIIKVDSSGQASLVRQFTISPAPLANPFPNGLAFVGDNLYAALGAHRVIVRVTGQPAVVAGQPGQLCHYTSSNCGDGGPGLSAVLRLGSSETDSPVAGIEGDANGLLIPDQGAEQRGRIRYLNLSANATTLSNTTIAPGNIDTLAGSGLKAPYDRGLAISADLSLPSGVAADANGNLFITELLSGRLRFVNRGATEVKLFAGTPAEQTVQPGHIVSVNEDAGSGDNNLANHAVFDTPQGLTSTAQGVFIAVSKGGPSISTIRRRTGLIRFLNTSSAPVTFYPDSPSPIIVQPGYVSTIAGGSSDPVSAGDGKLALAARLLGPVDVAVSPANGDIYIASVDDKTVRKINGRTGIISSLGLPSAYYTGLAFDSVGRLHIVSYDNGTVLRELAAGSGLFASMNGESRRLNNPRDIAVDKDGFVYVTEVGNAVIKEPAFGNRIARISPEGIVTTLAGRYDPGFEGDGDAALNAQLNLRPNDFHITTSGTLTPLPSTVGIAMGVNNDLFFCDVKNHRVRRISSLGNHCLQSGQIKIVGDNPVPLLTSVSAASFAAGTIAPESIVAAFGAGLAAKTEVATTIPLPTSLGGVKLLVKDSAGIEHEASLFAVSPTQLNYLMPGGVAAGNATVFAMSGQTPIASGQVQVASVAPSFFTANSTGEGLISGMVLRVQPTGAPKYEPIVHFDSESRRYVAIPIDLSAPTDQVYLIGFATGLRRRSNLSAVSVQLGGQTLPVTYAGEVPGTAGLDQINMGPLPQSLVGRGMLNLTLIVDGKTANSGQIAVR